MSYVKLKFYPMLEKVEKGVVLATGNGEPIISPITGHVIFCRPGSTITDPKFLPDEQMFITAPLRVRKRTLTLPRI